MIHGGDAIEVKKIINLNAAIALNSSYPKDKLYINSPMITSHCRNSEKWEIKDIIYAIGILNKEKLQALWFVYGDCYAAEQTIYRRIKDAVSNAINNNTLDIELAETKEIGRVNRIDPLGITSLRIRGMWHIENPIKTFNYITNIEPGKTTNKCYYEC